MNVLGYARVSTAEQRSNGYGLDAQEAAIRDECERRGWRLLAMRFAVMDPTRAMTRYVLRRGKLPGQSGRIGEPCGEPTRHNCLRQERRGFGFFRPYRLSPQAFTIQRRAPDDGDSLRRSLLACESSVRVEPNQLEAPHVTQQLLLRGQGFRWALA